MGEEEYQAAVAQTAELAAQLPRIGVVGRRPPQGPSMPQRLINHFRSPEAVLGKTMILSGRRVHTHAPANMPSTAGAAHHTIELAKISYWSQLCFCCLYVPSQYWG